MTNDDASTVDRTPSPRTDVCVVGAGPAGALVAHRLAAAGHAVVVLDAGPRFDGDRERRMERAIRPGDPRDVWGMGGDRDAYASSGDRDYPLNAARVKGVGGSTLHWQGMVMRLHERDFALRDSRGLGADWPIDYADLRPHYADAEEALGVAGTDDNPFAPPRGDFPLPGFPPSHSDGLFRDACDAIGIATHGVPNARNSEPHDDAPACVGYGTCQPVCPSGAKYTAERHVAAAEDAGARVVPRARATRLPTTDAGARVAGVRYAAPDGARHLQRARHVVLAAGGVEIPRLLLLSRDEHHPDGLANGSGRVGHYFMDHLFAGAGGTVDERTRQNHVGFNTTESHQFYDGTEPTPLAVKLEFLNYAGPSPVETALTADDWADALLDRLRHEYGNHVGVGALVEQLPRAANRVTLDPSTTDDLGDPVPDVRWSVGDRERRAIRATNRIQHRVLDELDADDRWTVGPADAGPAFHHMGTTRMGTDPDASVVDPRCRSHDVANLSVASSSVFPTGGAMNPTLTIAALALRLAAHLDAEL